MARQDTATNVATGTTRMFATRLQIPQDERRRVVEVLDQRLADSLDLFTQCKHAHWNVKGTDFYQLHELFDELADRVRGHSDLIAERITALGGVARGTLRSAAQRTSLTEFGDVFEDVACVEALAERFATVGANLRLDVERVEELGDVGSADMLTEVLREVDQSLYFLEAHLQRGTGA